jgi:hypothetical protein
MTNQKYILVLAASGLLTGCNPFGKNSFINIIDVIEVGQTTTEINSGGKTDLTTPQSGNPADIHSVSYSVGSPFRQTSFTTDNGHTVNVSISGTKRD